MIDTFVNDSPVTTHKDMYFACILLIIVMFVRQKCPIHPQIYGSTHNCVAPYKHIQFDSKCPPKNAPVVIAIIKYHSL